MSSETNQEAAVVPETTAPAQAPTPTIDHAELLSQLNRLNETVGSLKRENKDLKKSMESRTAETTESKTDSSALLEKFERMSLRQAGITSQDEIDLARETAKKWNMDIDSVLADEDFTAKLDRLRTKKQNEVATSNLKGGQGSGNAKNTAEYWQAKGTPPTPADVSDRKQRAAIIRSMMANNGSGKKFWND